MSAEEELQVSGVLVLHPWWGLNADILSTADRLRAEGYTVVSPDLYDGRLATEIPEAEKLMKAHDRQAAERMVNEAADELKRQGAYALLGWSMGGSYAWDLAGRRPGEVSALVAYYGPGEVDKTKPLPPVLSHVGELDEDAEYVRETDDALRGAGKDVTTYFYPGAKHWFDEPSRPEYDKAASELAWGRTSSFLRKHLR